MTPKDSKRPVALITGVTGQDGAYLAEYLLGLGYTGHGIERRSASFNTACVDHLYRDPHVGNAPFLMHCGDMTDSTNLIRLMQQIRPTEINLAAQSHVAVWGTGIPRREFLYVDDMADACVHLKAYSGTGLINIASGEDITIAEFARVVATALGYRGDISFNSSRPDGTPRKLLDIGRSDQARLARQDLAGRRASAAPTQLPGGEPGQRAFITPRLTGEDRTCTWILRQS